METNKTLTAFIGHKLFASGDIAEVLAAVKQYCDGKGTEQPLIFDDKTGKQIDFDLRGTLAEVLERVLPEAPKSGPGRPKIGVTGKEITLMPRHWEWLEVQPQKASGTIRRLVETAMKNECNAGEARRRHEAAGKFMWSIAGNLDGFEEASRALYARNWGTLEKYTASWPKDIKTHLMKMLDRGGDK
ncbi:MAG: DUF2239 family protein [Spirochaetaceae bacterium]|nr:MAG: DUF2239 family protein [Spirochaetaceae bacterium]